MMFQNSVQTYKHTDNLHKLENSIETQNILNFQASQLVRNSFPGRESSQSSHTFQVSIKKTMKKGLDRYVKILLSRIPQRRRDPFRFKIPFLALLLTISPISLSQFNYFLLETLVFKFSVTVLVLCRFCCKLIGLRFFF